jgi:hypothetical protein
VWTDKCIGAIICGTFVISATVSVILYRPWRRWIEHRRALAWEQYREEDKEDAGAEDLAAREIEGDDLIITETPTERLHIQGKKDTD